MKFSKKEICVFVAIVGVFIISFYFSNQSGCVSNYYSTKIIIKITNVLNMEKINYGRANYLFRKGLHFFEFSVLGILVYYFIDKVF